MYYVLVVTTTQFTYIHGMNYTLHHTHTHMSYVQIFYRQTYNKIDMSDRYIISLRIFGFYFFFMLQYPGTTNVLFQLTLWALGLFVTIKRLIIFAPIHLPPACYCL